MTQPKIDHREQVGSYSIQEITVDDVRVLAFTVRPGDVQPWDSGNIGPNQKPNERAEISLDAAPSSQKGKSQYDVRDGITQTYDVDYRFKAGFPPHNAAAHEWALITQFHPQDNNPSGFKGFSGVSIHDGMITLERPGSAGGDYFAAETIVADKWYHRRLVVKWSAGNDGFVKWIDRLSGKLLGGYNGPTIAANEYKYIKQGYYRAGGLPEATVYSTLIDISDGDLSATEAPEPTPVQPPTPPSPVQPAKPSVDPEAAAVFLMAAVDQLDEIVAGTMRVREAAMAVLDKGPYKPAG